MSKIIPALFAAFVFAISACSSSKISVREAEQFQGTAVMYYPMVAKIEINPEKIEYVYKDGQCYIDKECEILAYNDALKTLKIDGIFEPIYHHEVASFKTATVTVTGYAYKYKEFREATKEDRDLLASPGSTWIPVQTNNRPYITNDTSAPLWHVILGSVLGSLLILALIAN